MRANQHKKSNMHERYIQRFFLLPRKHQTVCQGETERGVAGAVVAGEAAKPNVMFAAKNKHDFFIRQILTHTHALTHAQAAELSEPQYPKNWQSVCLFTQHEQQKTSKVKLYASVVD